MALYLIDYKILIVDDLREMRLSLRHIVEALGARGIVEARSGADAIEKLRGEQFDIILCDYNMGEGRDGQQVFEEAKEHDLIAPHAVFIMITAENTANVVMSVVEHSPDGYIVKPMNKAVLETRMEKILARKKALKEVEIKLAAGAYADAVKICDDAIEKYPKMRVDLLRMKAEALCQLGEAEAVVDLCAEVLVERDIPWATVYMGRARYIEGNRDKARALFNKAIDQNNTVMEAYDWLVKVDRESGDLNEAQQTQQRAVTLSPNSIRRQQVLADLAISNGDYETGRAAFQSAVNLGRHSCFARVEDRLGLVNAVAETKGPTEALKVLQGFGRRRGRGRRAMGDAVDWRIDLSKGQLMLSNGQEAEAKRAIESAHKGYSAEPCDAADPTAIALAKSCFDTELTDEARAIMDRVVRENHDRDDVIAAARDMFAQLGMEGAGDELIDSARQAVVDINNRGVALAKERKLDEAVELLTQASDELPGNLTVAINVIQALLAQVRAEGPTSERIYAVREYLKRAEQIDPENPKLRKLREKVQSLQSAEAQAQQVVA